MSTNVSQQSVQPVIPPKALLATPTYEEKMSWWMRKSAFIVLSIGYLLTAISGIVLAFITKDPHFLWLDSSILFTPVIYYLVPMDQKRYELKKLEIELKLKNQRLDSNNTQDGETDTSTTKLITWATDRLHKLW